MAKENQGQGPKDEAVINIDRKQYKVNGDSITGAALRQLPDPNIAPDRAVFREVPGGEDVEVLDSDVVMLKNGMHFFSTPREVNPG